MGTVFEGLSTLFTALYGIRLEPAPVAPGEICYTSIRKLHVIHERDGKIGTIYCDLYLREVGHKYQSPAHVMVRGSRRIGDEELRDKEVYGGGKLLRNDEGEKVVVGWRFALPGVVLVMGLRDRGMGRQRF